MSERDQAITLNDGRLIGFAEWGDPGGTVVLYFHGTPSSRLDPVCFPRAATSAGVRLLSLDRPGIGLSTVKPHRRIVDWPADVAGFADALEIGRLGVIGWSGGGPYVLACAARLATRLTGAALVAGVGPFDRTAALKGLSAMDRWSYRLARTTPAAARMALGAIYALSRRRPDQARQSFRSDRYQSKTAASSTHSAMEPSPWAGSSSRGVREPAAPSRSTAP